jgi:hypothetical protein
MDRRARELVLISVLAAFCDGLAWLIMTACLLRLLLQLGLSLGSKHDRDEAGRQTEAASAPEIRFNVLSTAYTAKGRP